MKSLLAVALTALAGAVALGSTLKEGVAQRVPAAPERDPWKATAPRRESLSDPGPAVVVGERAPVQAAPASEVSARGDSREELEALGYELAEMKRTVGDLRLELVRCRLGEAVEGNGSGLMPGRLHEKQRASRRAAMARRGTLVVARFGRPRR